MKNEPEFFLIQSLAFDPELQVRIKINEDTIADYAERMESEEEMKAFPPVEIFYDGARYWLADGHHRRAAAEMAGHDKVWAIIKSGTRADAVWAAILGNGKQGFGLTRADKQRAIILAIAHWPDKSNRVIADAVGSSKDTVRRIRDSISGGANALPETRTGKDGKEYTLRGKPTAAEEEPDSPDFSEEDISEISMAFPDPDEFGEEEHYPPLSQPIPEKDAQFVQTVKLQNIPLNDPERLIACLFDLFERPYREKLVLDLVAQMEIDDGKKCVQRILIKLCKKQSK